MMRSDLIAASMPQPRRLRFSVDDYYKMISMGMIEDHERSEIIDGEIVPKMTIGDRHAWVVDMLARIFIKALPDTIRVCVQNPLRLSDYDEPEPDIVLADLTRYDGKRHPQPEETMLVVEVSDKTLRYDRDTKLPMYANAGIREVWIVNLCDNVIEIHHSPVVGIYQNVGVFGSGDVTVSTILPDLDLAASDILTWE